LPSYCCLVSLPTRILLPLTPIRGIWNLNFLLIGS
jgi:hypothetical protein